MSEPNDYGLDEFVVDVRKVMANVSDVVEQGTAVGSLLPKLLRSRNWIHKVADINLREKSKEKEVYVDPDFGFAIFVYTHPPGFTTGIHTHGPRWVLYGVYENQMKHNRFQLVTEGVTEGEADVITIEPAVQIQGTALPPIFQGFGHQVVNDTDQYSINVRVISDKPDSVIPWGDRLQT